jgi:hypothetical protein
MRTEDQELGHRLLALSSAFVIATLIFLAVYHFGSLYVHDKPLSFISALAISVIGLVLSRNELAERLNKTNR